jgi:site-specific DNA-methyltransferase (adenine-specific)
MVMQPYYQHAGITIYHGDCLDVLPTLSERIAIVTDQPYGTGWVKGGGRAGEFNAQHEKQTWDVWDMSWVGLAPNICSYAVFGPYSRAKDLQAHLPQPNNLVWWHKTNPRPNGPRREPICISPVYLPDGLEFLAYNGDTPLHPNQKPIDLMLWIMGFIPDDATILDPFMGSGSTLVAAKQLGRKAIGIELDERYCEIAANRLQQEIMELSV